MKRVLVAVAFLLPAVPAAQASAPSSVARALHESVAALRADAMVAASEGDPIDDWDWVDNAPPSEPNPRLSPLKAVVASAVMPGWGESLAGRPERSKLFLGVESAIWATFAYYRIQADQRQDRQVEFAHTQAGAPEDQDSDYYEHIGLWLSLQEWHDIVRQDARLRFPDDAAAQQAFFEANKRYDEGQSWSWADDDARTSYRRLRSKAERSYRNARLAAGAALFNRLASVVDALAVTRSHNRALGRAESERLDLRVAPMPAIDGLVIGPVLTTRY